jgi:hypothetical protein
VSDWLEDDAIAAVAVGGGAFSDVETPLPSTPGTGPADEAPFSPHNATAIATTTTGRVTAAAMAT